MTFDEVKALILSRSRAIGTCKAFHNANVATDYPSLIAAGTGMDTGDMNPVMWLSKKGIIDASLLTEVGETDLNAAGIYTTGTPTFTNPANDIVLLGDVIATIDFSGDNSADIFLGQDSALNLSIADNSFAEMKAYDSASITADVNDNGSFCITFKDGASGTITLDGDSNSTITCSNNSNVTINANGNAWVKIITMLKANVTLNITGTPTIVTESYDSSIINSPSA